MRLRDLVGLRFGRLLVLAASKRGYHVVCSCRCDCGADKVIRHSSLKSGYTRSCGCIARERMTVMNTKHGECIGERSAEWSIWRGMHGRCYTRSSTSYPNYGGRGIRVCERWKIFENFLADMGRKPFPSAQIDRIDNEGNYEPSNCRWVTPSQNSRNRRAPRRRASCEAAA